MDALFAVQTEDVARGQLEHQLSVLVERSKLDAEKAIRSEIATEAEGLDLERLDHARRQHRYEGEVAAVEARLSELNQKLYGGAITSPKEAVSIQGEMGHLKKRQDDLELQVLEVMEVLDPIDGRIAELAAKALEQDAMVVAADQALEAAEGKIGSLLEQSSARRVEAAADVPSDLLSRYEKSFSIYGASTVVRFAGSDCSGCPSSMPAVEADRVRRLSPGTLADCSECGRLVVR